MTTETILTDDAIARILSKKYGYPVDEVFRADHSAARSIEQAVLKSEQVQALKRDADRYRYLREHKTGVYSCDNDGRDLLTHKVVEVSFEVIKKDHDKRDIKDVLDTAIDATMGVLHD